MELQQKSTVYTEWHHLCAELQALIGCKDANAIIGMVEPEANTYQIDTACTRMICVIKLAQAGVLSKQLICMVAERMECAVCKLAMRSGLI